MTFDATILQLFDMLFKTKYGALIHLMHECDRCSLLTHLILKLYVPKASPKSKPTQKSATALDVET